MTTRRERVEQSTPEALTEFVGRGAPVLRETRHAHGHGAGHGPAPMDTVREATHRGHRILIRTTYRIEVDGVPLEGHMAVTNDGRVHYHPMPNVNFASAVDMVKQLIDAFPDDFGSALEPPALEVRAEAGATTARATGRRRSRRTGA